MVEQISSMEKAGDAEYDSAYYRNYWGGGGPYERNERWLKFFDEVAEGIVRGLHPSSVLDAGCAMGFLVEALHNRGVDAHGIDVSDFAISQVHESVADRCEVASLTEPLTGRYDLITCIEVIEHIPSAETDKAIANLCGATDRILLSSTPGDYGEPTHVNVRQPEDWAAAFAREGFIRDLGHDASYLSPWATLYVRNDQALAETVRGYDRSLWRLQREVDEARESLIGLQNRLSEVEGESWENRSDLRLELDRQREEVMRLRDLLIGRDAELGAARGQLTQLEEQSQRISAAAERVQGKIPGMGLIAALFRRLRSLRGG